MLEAPKGRLPFPPVGGFSLSWGKPPTGIINHKLSYEFGSGGNFVSFCQKIAIDFSSSVFYILLSSVSAERSMA